uniref:Glutathione S-transferase n=1 Tax=Oryza brachyantha TaxID=4533 RepID=J3N4B1_ORYBR
MAGQNELKLLGSWASAYVTRVKLALHLKSVTYDYVEEDLRNKSDLLLESNPVHKKVPVLIHNGKPICESQIIVEYIDEVFSGDGESLLPADPHERAVARFWAAYIEDKVNSPLKTNLITFCKGYDMIAYTSDHDFMRCVHVCADTDVMEEGVQGQDGGGEGRVDEADVRRGGSSGGRTGGVLQGEGVLLRRRQRRVRRRRAGRCRLLRARQRRDHRRQALRRRQDAAPGGVVGAVRRARRRHERSYQQ